MKDPYIDPTFERLSFDWEPDPSPGALTVIDFDSEPKSSGLLDASGQPLMIMPERVGFWPKGLS